MKRNVEIEDNLDAILSSLLEYLEENPDNDDYGDQFEQAFDDAGIGDKNDDGWPMGWKAAAIYCYIEQHVAEWYDENAADIFDE